MVENSASRPRKSLVSVIAVTFISLFEGRLHLRGDVHRTPAIVHAVRPFKRPACGQIVPQDDLQAQRDRQTAQNVISRPARFGR